MTQKTSQQHRNYRTVFIIVIIVIAMFGFGFALVPIYNVMCNVLGINGKPDLNKATNTSHIDSSRTITVQFLATNNANLAWEFKPSTLNITLHPGENRRVTYFAKNLTHQTMTVQAIPSVTPSLAAKYLKKTECFCFNQQTLRAGEAMDMPIIFHLDNALPQTIHTITLSYTLFAVKNTLKHRNKRRGRL